LEEISMIKLKRRAFLAGTSAVIIFPAQPALEPRYTAATLHNEKV
jgi:peptide/nickel transport system substrate-binding protein